MLCPNVDVSEWRCVRLMAMCPNGDKSGSVLYGDKQSDPGGWWLVASCWWLVAGDWWLVAGDW